MNDTVRTHQVPTGTMTAAFQKAATGLTAFDFDLIDHMRKLTSHEFGNRILGKIAFACDAYIGIAIQRSLSNMRNAHELEGTATWDSYQAFLHYAAGLATSEETMIEGGMEVKPLREQVQRLFDVRTECHGILSTRIGGYETPSITDFMAKPRLRRDDADTVRKIKSVLRSQATDDDGVIDVALEQELENAYTAKSAFEKIEQLKWDKMRGELAATFFNALRIRDDRGVDATISHRDMILGAGDSSHDAFGDLDAETQYKLLHGSIRYVTNTLLDGAKDRKVEFTELAKWQIESRPLLKALRQAVEHTRFANVGK